MATRDTWAALIAEIRQASDPMLSRATGRLYRLALSEGIVALAPMTALGEGDREDIASEAFIAKLPALLQANSPRGLYLTIVTNRARDHLRGLRRREERARQLEQAAVQPIAGQSDEARATQIDGQRALQALSPRDRDVVLAVWHDEEREEVAARFGTSRANVDQIISRFRKRLLRGDS